MKAYVLESVEPALYTGKIRVPYVSQEFLDGSKIAAIPNANTQVGSINGKPVSNGYYQVQGNLLQEDAINNAVLVSEIGSLLGLQTDSNNPYMFNSRRDRMLYRFPDNDGGYYGYVVGDLSGNSYDLHFIYTTHTEENVDYTSRDISTILDTRRLSRTSVPFLFGFVARETWLGGMTFGLCYTNHEDNGFVNSLTFGHSFNVWETALDGIPEEEESPYPEESTEGGYTGATNFDHSSDTISFPAHPAISISNMGFLNVYRVSRSSLENLLTAIMPELQVDALTDIGEVLKASFKQTVNGDLLKYVIGLHAVPVNPTEGATTEIKVGFRETGCNGFKLSCDYVDFDCGSVNISEFYNNFLDYTGTKAEVFCPMVGFVPIEPELFLDGTLSIKYKFNVLDGTFICCILSSSSKSQLRNTVIGTYSGACAVHMPLTSTDYASLMSNIVAGAVSTGSAMLTAGTTAGAAVAGVKASMSALNNINSKPYMNMSNGFNTSAAYMGVKVPYIKISRPVAQFPKNYRHENGLPLNVTAKLSTLSGFTICDNPHLDFECSEKERQEIYKILTTGIIL